MGTDDVDDNVSTGRITPPPPAGRRPPPSESLAPPPRPSKLPIVIAFLLGGIAVAMTYLAWQLWIHRERAVAQLESAQTQFQTLQAERDQSVKKVSELERERNEQRAHVTQSEAQLTELKTKLGAAESRLAELEDERQALSDRMEEFRRVTQQFQRMIDSGKLQVNFRRGRMIVDLPAAVLFASGSAELSQEGQDAIVEVAKILRQVPGKRFIVGGHTDNIPISKAEHGYANNWALSASRAVTVTNALIGAGLRANHLVAAGFGEYDPIASNGKPTGRQKNRRIEIVLEPELRDVPDVTPPATAAPAAASDQPNATAQ